MHTVELLERALAAARASGFHVRHEWLGGGGGGDCLIKGQKWLFLDLAQSPAEQLIVVMDALQSDPHVDPTPLSSELRQMLDLRKSA